MVKNTGSSSRGSGFNSQYLHVLYNHFYVILVLGNLMLSSVSARHAYGIHTGCPGQGFIVVIDAMTTATLRKENISLELVIAQRFSPLSSLEDAWQHADRHDTGEVAEFCI